MAPGVGANEMQILFIISTASLPSFFPSSFLPSPSSSLSLQLRFDGVAGVGLLHTRTHSRRHRHPYHHTIHVVWMATGEREKKEKWRPHTHEFLLCRNYPHNFIHDFSLPVPNVGALQPISFWLIPDMSHLIRTETRAISLTSFLLVFFFFSFLFFFFF